MNILYAGAGGLAAACAALMAPHAHGQWALRRSPTKAHDVFDLSLSGDVRQIQALALPAQPSHVVFTATPAARTSTAYQDIYQHGLANLLAVLNTDTLQRFVFVSSTAVYGPSELWVDETTPAQPQSFNGQALLDAENFLARALGDKLVVLRLAGLYGPRRTQLFERLREGRATVPAGTGHWVNRLHDEDAARLCAWALSPDAPPGVYVGVDDTPMEMSVLYDTLAAWLAAPSVARGPPQAPTGKRLSNRRLVNLGFRLAWPSSLDGYRDLVSIR